VCVRVCSELVSHDCIADGLSLVGRYDLSTGKWSMFYRFPENCRKKIEFELAPKNLMVQLSSAVYTRKILTFLKT
jgi:hypothetical protein